MINSILLVPVLASFFITLFLLPYWIRKAKEIGLVWPDMNKSVSEKVSGSGGLIVVLGFLIGSLLFVAYRIFYLKESIHLISILSALLVILMLSATGFIDDLLGWRKGGLSKRSRIILVFLAAIPLMVINAGKDIVSIPILGNIPLGIIYPLIIIPLGIIGATTTFNFLAGFNGLEAGQGIIVLTALSFVAFFTGNSCISILGLCMAASLFAFLIYNFHPAKVFPGDVLTYPVGGLIAVMAILGNFEKIAVFFFIPYIIEFFLKLRGRLLKQSFGKPRKSGELDLEYEKIYGLTHLSILLLKKMRIKSTEKNAVYLIWIFHLTIIILGFLIFGRGIFLNV